MRKIRLICADYDQTLVPLGKAHFNALNEALSLIDKKFIISEEEQIARFEGLTTKTKLNILVKEKNFPLDKIQEVFNLKQQLTAQAINKTINYDENLVSTFKQLKLEGYKLYITSNAIKETIIAGLEKTGISNFFDDIISNEDISNPKPHPEIYLKAMVKAGVAPDETLIIEDSKNGKISAQRSGAYLLDVDCPADTTYKNIKNAIIRAEKINKPLPWSAKNTLNVLIPLAGSGSRLRSLYQLPKPLIDIKGKTMIHRVVESLNIDANYIFIVQKEHYDQYNLGTYLKLIVPDCKIVITDRLTDGAACTSLLAKELINNNKHLLIANADQLLTWSSSDFLYHTLSKKVDGSILCFSNNGLDEKWSYAKLDDDGFVSEVVEKKPISTHPTIGVYYFDKGSDYVKAAEEMIAANDRCGKEFYIAPAYNYMIKDGKKINIYNIDVNNFHPTGTIEDLEKVLNTLEFNE